MRDMLVELYQEVIGLAQQVIQLQNNGKLPPLQESKIMEKDGKYYLFVPSADEVLWVVYEPDGITIADGADFALVRPVLKDRAGFWDWSQLQEMKSGLEERIALAKKD